ncbi:hypothetical protein EIP73_01775 [Xylella fastidiosa subsp. pauca]|nr:hypothetical protein EIP73_01775 [Xylella fastidiosa subsp. pauca]
MRELSKVEMEQISGGCLTDIVTGVNMAFRLISNTLNTLFSDTLSTLFNTATNIIASSRKS